MILLAKIDESWSGEHRQAVEQLQNQMDREICGAPTSSGLPCKEWPAGEHGRCSRHDPSREQEPERAVNTSSPNTDDSIPSSINPLHYWIVLGFIGLFLGGAAATSYLLSDYADWDSPARSVDSEQPASIDVNDPDWSRLFNMEDAGNIILTLNQIVEETNSAETRSRALYYQFNFYQNNDQPGQALSVAENFINSFPDHALRAEVLYGAGIICERQVDSCDTDYHALLREEYPDSSWTAELSS